MALFEEINGELRFRDGAGDSGADLNAEFTLTLFKGREYVLRLGLYWEWESGQTAVMMT
jgi:hypothetical protein